MIIIIQEINNTFQSKFMTYKDYLQTDHWKDTRKTKLKKSAYKCQLCSSNKELQVHHNTYERLGYEKDTDLVVLCSQCHSKFHDINIKKDNIKKNNDNDFLVEVTNKTKVNKRIKNENESITNVYIDNNYCTEDSISIEAFFVYLGLRRLYRRGIDKYYINISLLSYILYCSPVATRYITSYIIKGLKDLENKKIITEIEIEKNKRKNEWIYDLSKLDLNTNAKGVYYTIVNSSKITKLVQYQGKTRLRLLRFYCYLMTTIMKTGEKKRHRF